MGMTCEICGSGEQSDMHILLEDPFGGKMWEASGVEARFWATTIRFVQYCIEMAMVATDRDELGMFLAILSGFWPAHNTFIFQVKEINLAVVCQRVVALVKSFRKVSVKTSTSLVVHPQ